MGDILYVIIIILQRINGAFSACFTDQGKTEKAPGLSVSCTRHIIAIHSGPEVYNFAQSLTEAQACCLVDTACILSINQSTCLNLRLMNSL